MYRFLSLVFAAFLCVSCFSNGNTVKSANDSDPVSEAVDADQGESSGESAADIDIATTDEISEADTSDEDFEETEEDDGFTDDSGKTEEADSDPDNGSDEQTVTDEEETDDEYEEIDDFGGDSIHIRIVAGNITSGNGQSYDPGEGIRIFKALKPDIALVQEMNYKNNSDSDYRNFAQQIVGKNYYAVDSADYQIPNGVVSRYPIRSHGYWTDPNINNRALMWAVVDIPGNTDIFAISVHLHTKPASDQVKAAQVIVDEIAKVKEKNPGKYYYVVGGDFNGDSAVSSNGFGKNNTFYVDGPDPVDEDKNGNTNAGRKKQYDFVLADYPLHQFQIPVVYYSSKDPEKTKTYEDGLVFDTRVYSQSELDEYFSPAETGDSGASNMQHMAVVKDFFIEFNK